MIIIMNINPLYDHYNIHSDTGRIESIIILLIQLGLGKL